MSQGYDLNMHLHNLPSILIASSTFSSSWGKTIVVLQNQEYFQFPYALKVELEAVHRKEKSPTPPP